MLVATVRPLYADTDQMGVVSHIAALRFFEQARAEWLRRLGYTYRELETTGIMLPVYDVQVRYRQPVYYDELLNLEAHVELPSVVRILFHYRIVQTQQGNLLIEGTTRHAVVGRAGRPQRLPDSILSLLQRGIAEQGVQDGSQPGT